MVGKKSTYLRKKIIEHVLGIAAYTMPTNVYLALYTSDPTIADTGTEVTGGSYARQQLAFAAESGGMVVSAGDETFTDMPACTVTHWGLRDASSGGNLLYFGTFDIPLPFNAGDDPTFLAANIYFSEK
jgi:hypothetical protein